MYDLYSGKTKWKLKNILKIHQKEMEVKNLIIMDLTLGVEFH